MTPKFPKNTRVTFNDGSNDRGTVLEVDIDSVGRYYLVQRIYPEQQFKTLTHWYGEDELE